MKIVSSLALSAPPERKSGIATVVAVQQVRRMRGGSQAHLMRCTDQSLYVVKFRNNPQHLRILANEMLVAVLARLAGLPVPEPAVVEVGEWLIQHTPELNIQTARGKVACHSGLQFGSRYAVHPLQGQVFDYLPTTTLLGRVVNLETFAGILTMDKWTCNSDGRQSAFWRLLRQSNYHAAFIDQGHCFNGGEWTFSDNPLCGVYMQNEVYATVMGWESFEPWLSRIEDMSRNTISAAAQEIPAIWYEDDSRALEALVRKLGDRRSMIRNLLIAFRSSSRKPFPNWATEAQSK